mmetsp:Transcript_28204/g.90899  ORF Transcript_28204/g.90899 Transcript_28204/m.90899 type:complete len:283 (-) Transcript_28204:431-1279(-)
MFFFCLCEGRKEGMDGWMMKCCLFVRPTEGRGVLLLFVSPLDVRTYVRTTRIGERTDDGRTGLDLEEPGTGCLRGGRTVLFSLEEGKVCLLCVLRAGCRALVRSFVRSPRTDGRTEGLSLRRCIILSLVFFEERPSGFQLQLQLGRPVGLNWCCTCVGREGGRSRDRHPGAPLGRSWVVECRRRWVAAAAAAAQRVVGGVVPVPVAAAVVLGSGWSFLVLGLGHHRSQGPLGRRRRCWRRGGTPRSGCRSRCTGSASAGRRACPPRAHPKRRPWGRPASRRA